MKKSMQDYEEDARKRRESPEAGQFLKEAMRLLDEAEDKLFYAGELELMDRVHVILGVLWGVNELEDLCRRPHLARS